MRIIGIDLSINYPAMCVCEDFERLEFIGFVNDPRMSGVNLQYLLSETPKYDGVTVVNISDERVNNHVYHVDERNKLLNFHRIIGRMLTELRRRGAAGDAIVAIEGISYGSKGSSLVDICMLTGAFRRAVLTDVLGNNANRLFVFAPSELKNAIGLKGNATKTEVLAKFVDCPGMPAAENCGMRQFMADHVPGGPSPSEYVYNTRRDEVGSPFNDMLDAYLGVLKIRQNAA